MAAKDGWRSPKVRRPRSEVQPFVDLLVSEMPVGIEYHMLGSWRRGAPDIDVVVITESGELSPNLLDDGVQLPKSFDAQRNGPKVAQGDLVLPTGARIHLDVWSCKPNERGAYLMFATGPMELNLMQRRRAIKLGYALSQIGLLDATTKHQLDNGTERDIYRLIEWPWLEPEQRQRFVNPHKTS